MNITGRELLKKWWGEAWSDGLWAAGWRASIATLTAAEAAWKPPVSAQAPTPRHSIWQHVLHMVFWREDNLKRLAGGPKPTAAELATGNFPEIVDSSPEAWATALARFEETHRRIAAALSDETMPLDRVAYLLPHDCYHFGQINLLRAMQGMKAIE